MIIDAVTICDFRSFSGVHEMSLTPRVRYGATRPIVLFGGLNGSGKTTLLLAIKFALYGRHALGLGTSKSDYEQFIKSCIHAPPGCVDQTEQRICGPDIHIRKTWQEKHLSGSARLAR